MRQWATFLFNMLRHTPGLHKLCVLAHQQYANMGNQQDQEDPFICFLFFLSCFLGRWREGCIVFGGKGGQLTVVSVFFLIQTNHVRSGVRSQ